MFDSAEQLEFFNLIVAGGVARYQYYDAIISFHSEAGLHSAIWLLLA